MPNDTPMVDCPCCGRIHEDKPGDCRRFFACPECGDAYAMESYAEHVRLCDGEPSYNIDELELSTDSK